MKAKQLTKLYAKEIAEIKKFDQVAEKLLADAKNASEGLTDEYEIYVAERQAYQAWQDAKHEAAWRREKLTYDIEAEYRDVPFVKSFRKCVAAFFREAGL